MSLLKQKKEFIKQAKKVGIAKATASYDGGGDSGSVDMVSFVDKNGKNLENTALSDLLTDIAYRFLEEKHPGWEINDGSQGQLVVDISNESMKLEHNERYTDSTYYESEL